MEVEMDFPWGCEASGEVTIALIVTLSDRRLAVRVDRRPHAGGREGDVSEEEKQRRREERLAPLDTWTLSLQGGWRWMDRLRGCHWHCGSESG